jgi:hypothetical protein
MARPISGSSLVLSEWGREHPEEVGRDSPAGRVYFFSRRSQCVSLGPESRVKSPAGRKELAGQRRGLLPARPGHPELLEGR